MTSLRYPDAGSRQAEDSAGRPAAAKPVAVYADGAGTAAAEIYADNDGVKGALIASAALTTDQYGYLPFWWGPADGTDLLYVSVNSGPVWPVDAILNSRIDALTVRVTTLESGGGGGGGDDGAALAAHEADTTNVHGVADTAVLETQPGAQGKVDLAVGTHAASTTNVHGVASMTALETQSGAQAKADAAQAASVAASAAAAADRALSNLTSASSARTNLGLGDVATRTVGTAPGTAAAGDDSRFFDARTPTTHAATHSSGGGDPVVVAQAQITGLSATLATKADLVAGVVPSSQLPDLVINATYPVESEAAMLAADASVGDVAVRIDQDPAPAFMLIDTDPTDLDNWRPLGLAGNVLSVNGQTGAVTLTAAGLGAVPTTRAITAGTGLTGGGDLTGDRTLTVAYGTTAGVAAQGNDSRITGALQAAGNLAALTDAAAARTNLGLAGGATRNIGTTVGALLAPEAVDAKGDLLVGTAADTVGRLPVGAANYIPVADPAQTAGIRWAPRTHRVIASDPKYGTPGTRAAFINALDAAEALGKHTIVYLPDGFTVDVVQGLSLSGRSVQLRGAGSGITSGVPTCSVIRASAQTGPVLDYTGYVLPVGAYGRITPLADIHVQGDGVADPGKTHAGIRISAISSTLFRDISVRDTGGPCMDLTPVTSGDACYLADFERITLTAPVGAQANDVPWFIATEANCNRFRSFGLRGNSATGIVGVSGAVVYAQGTSFSGHDNLWDAWWFEYLHAPTGGTLISCTGNAQVFSNIQFVDCGKEPGATGTSYYRLHSPTITNSGGNLITGIIPGDDNATATTGMDTGVRVYQSRNRIVGVRGYRAANVTLESGADYTYVELGGSVSGTGGAAVINNSGATHNVLIDHILDTATYQRYKMTGQPSGVGGPRIDDVATPANGGVWFGNAGAGVQTIGASTYYSTATGGGGTHIFRQGTSAPILSLNTSGGAALAPVSSSASHPDVQFSAAGFATRLGASGPQTRYGTGSPEGVVTGPVGSQYIRTDGGAGTTYYLKESGTGNTGWVGINPSGTVPAAHAASHAPGGTDPLSALTATSFAAGSIDGTAGTASLRTLGAGAQQAAAGNDTRIVGATQTSNNLADLADPATARGNLGLGGAAVLAVGVTAGTVAAGNDSRLHDADLLTAGEFVPPRRFCTSSAVGPGTTGTLTLSYWTADKTETITTVTTYTGGTAAAATPTLCRIGIFSVAANGNLTLVASTANDTTLWAGTFTAYARTLAASFGKVAGTRYALGLLVVSAGTIPTFHGAQFGGTAIMNTICAVEPAITSSLSGQADLPASISAGSLTSARVGVLFRLT